MQHKQIRPKDLRNEMDEFGMPEGIGGPGAGRGGYPRSQFSSTLPPSGPMASQNMWYDNRNPSQGGNGGGGGNGGPDGSDGTGGVNKPGIGGDEGTDLTSQSTGADTTQLQLGTSGESPLATLGTLQNALPDVSGQGPNTPE